MLNELNEIRWCSFDLCRSTKTWATGNCFHSDSDQRPHKHVITSSKMPQLLITSLFSYRNKIGEKDTLLYHVKGHDCCSYLSLQHPFEWCQFDPWIYLSREQYTDWQDTGAAKMFRGLTVDASFSKYRQRKVVKRVSFPTSISLDPLFLSLRMTKCLLRDTAVVTLWN